MTQPRVRARVWDPTNPALLVPRLVGGGWTVNLGALAVRLGLLRPDDYDADVLPHIPRAATGAAHAVPVVLATGTCAALAASWRRLPDRVPTSWSATDGSSGRAHEPGWRRWRGWDSAPRCGRPAPPTRRTRWSGRGSARR
ncbi:MAG: hypothetical protein IPK37_17375 [Austwickia sp.]|nr:MAG: hypothetical protein IPK37_17375 [Austwickia sp.]